MGTITACADVEVSREEARRMARILAADDPVTYGPDECTEDHLTEAILRWYQQVFDKLKKDGHYHFGGRYELNAPYLSDVLGNLQRGH
jgi:hypothetical protein